MRLIDADMAYMKITTSSSKYLNGQAKRAAQTIISNTPTVKDPQRWIPTSERMPEPSYGRVLISGTVMLGSSKVWGTDVARWNGDTWIFEGYPLPEAEVLAWMPLPEPYKGGDTE